MNLGNRIRHSAKWLTASSLGGQVLHFGIGVVLARILAPEAFGLLVTTNIFTGFAGYLASGGTGEALVQAKQADEQDYDIAFTLQLCAGALIYTIFFLISPWFARWFGQAIYKDLLRVSALTFIIRPFVGVARVRLRREMRFKILAIVDFVGLLVAGVTGIGAALYGMGVWSLVASGLLASLASGVLLLVITGWRPRLALNTAVARRLSGYGFKTSAAELISYFRWQTSNFLIARALGETMVALYNKADSLAKTPLGTISNSVYQPVFTALSQVQEDHDRSRYIYLRTITLLSTYTLPLYVGLGWLAEPFIRFAYGEQWAGSAGPLSILSLAGLAFCVGHPAGAVLAAQNWLGRELYVQISALAAVVLGCAVGLHWGIEGVAWGMVAAHFFSAWHITWLVHRCIGVRAKAIMMSLIPAVVLNSLLATVLLGADAFFLSPMRSGQPAIYLLLMSLTGAIVYIFGFLYFPLPALRAEAHRWKRILSIERN